MVVGSRVQIGLGEGGEVAGGAIWNRPCSIFPVDVRVKFTCKIWNCLSKPRVIETRCCSVLLVWLRFPFHSHAPCLLSSLIIDVSGGFS